MMLNEPLPQTTVREDILAEAAKLVTGDRNKTYGSPTQNFQDTANVWNVLLRAKLGPDAKITPGDVAAMMVALKLVRMIAQPNIDNWVDIAGYAACGAEVDVETGRIVLESDESPSQTSWGQPGDILVLTPSTPQPGNHVHVLKQLPGQGADSLPYLVRQNGQWGWSAHPYIEDRFSENVAGWGIVTAAFSNYKFEVVS